MVRKISTMKVAFISHGKDSIAMLHVIFDILKWECNRIMTADVWFDNKTRAELPPMVEWKEKADEIILAKWGIPVEHINATKENKKLTYCDLFYQTHKSGKRGGAIHGFPMITGGWCTGRLKTHINFSRRTKARWCVI